MWRGGIFNSFILKDIESLNIITLSIKKYFVFSLEPSTP